MRRRTIVLAILVAIVIPSTLAVRFYLRGTAFVVQAAGIGGRLSSPVRWYLAPVAIADVPPIPWRGGVLRARAYRSTRDAGRNTRHPAHQAQHGLRIYDQR